MEIAEILIVLVLAIFAIINGSKWKKINNWKKGFVCLSIIGAFIIAWNAIGRYQRNKLIEEVNEKIGNIKDLEGAANPVWRIGHSGTLIHQNFKGPLFADNEGNPMCKVLIKANKLLVTALVRNKKGKIIGVLNENEWTVFDTDYEYNNDKTAFEMVTAGEREVVFQIELKNGIVGIKGVIVGKNGDGLYLCEDLKSGGSTMTLIEKGEVTRLPLESLTTLFKYPRGRYLSIRSPTPTGNN